MSISDKTEIEDILDRVKEQAKVDRKLIQEQLGDRPYGHKEPNDAEFLMWWAQKIAENPPVQVIAPDGMPMTISLFILALSLAENGDEWFTRHRAAVRREAERTAEALEKYALEVP